MPRSEQPGGAVPETGRRFMVLLHPCRDDFWATLKPREAEIIREHYDLLAALQEAGQLEFGGRAKDDKYGFLILKMASKQHVEAAFADNPAVACKLLRVEIKPYNLALGDDP